MNRILLLTYFIFTSVILCINTTNAAVPIHNENLHSNKVVVYDEYSAPQNIILIDSNQINPDEDKSSPSTSSDKKANQVVAALLAFFLGILGIHNFYMGLNNRGLIQLGATLLSILISVAGGIMIASGLPIGLLLTFIGYIMFIGVGVWTFIDFIRILIGNLEPEEGFDS